jgi:hypothetical protein
MQEVMSIVHHCLPKRKRVDSRQKVTRGDDQFVNTPSISGLVELL